MGFFMSLIYGPDGRPVTTPSRGESASNPFKETASKVHDVFARDGRVVIVCDKPAKMADATYMEAGKHAGKWEVALTFSEACDRLDAIAMRAHFDGEADDLCDLTLRALRDAYKQVHGKDPPPPVRESVLRRYWR